MENSYRYSGCYKLCRRESWIEMSTTRPMTRALSNTAKAASATSWIRDRLSRARQHGHFGAIAQRQSIAARLWLGDADHLAPVQLEESRIRRGPVFRLKREPESALGTAADVALAALAFERFRDDPDHPSRRRL